MSLEANKNNVELKELYANVLEAGNDYDNLPDTHNKITASTKLKLKDRIEKLKQNSQYEMQSTSEEKAKIDGWYQSSIS